MNDELNLNTELNLNDASKLARQAAAEQAAVPVLSKEDKYDALIRSLLRREEAVALKEMAAEEQAVAKAKQRAINSKNRNEKSFLKQSRCTHLKGGKIKSKTGIKDFALFHHTYIDKRQIIGCFICKMRWKPGDTAAYLVRNGRKIKNHTAKGWAQACEMFGQSSNTPSMSEIPQTYAEPETAGGEDFDPAEVQ